MSPTAFESLLGDFLAESHERLDRVQESLLSLQEGDLESRKSLVVEAKRELHTLKGNSGMMGLPNLQSLAHEVEDQVLALDVESPEISEILSKLDLFRSLLKGVGGQGDSPSAKERDSAPDPGKGLSLTTVRVPFDSLDAMVDLAAEMVVFRNRLTDAIGKGREAHVGDLAWDEVDAAMEALDTTLGQIQSGIMQLRMVPLKTLFGHLKRIVHDEAERLGKQVHFEADGGETPMDKALLEIANEALGHLVRNAVVHAVEMPSARRELGKPPSGSVRIAASSRAGEVWIEVCDDGSGMDRAALLAAAERKGIDTSGIEDAYSLIFMPEFSTAAGTDTGSGRGMGLSAVTEAVHRIGGRIEVFSEKGKGTRFLLRLPLSVSVTGALMVRADGEEYAVPMQAVVEALRFEPGDGHEINHAGVFWWRGFLVPLIDLGFIYQTAKAPRRGGYVIIIEGEGKNRGIIADDLNGVRQIVVKDLDPAVGRPPGVSGTTILGDGRVVLILDPRSLAAMKPFVVEQLAPVG